MSENHDYLRTSTTSGFRLRADITALMLKGAGYAAIFCLATWFVIWAIYAVGLLLPPESKERPDPTPYSLLVPATERVLT